MRFDLSSDLSSRIPEVFGRAHGVKGSETHAMGLTSYYTKVYNTDDERPYGTQVPENCSVAGWPQTAKLNPKYNLCHTLFMTDLRSYLLV
jgi:hypothetical protein